MATEELATGAPAYVIWFSSSVLLATVIGVLGGRDGVVKQTWAEKYELRLARLNHHLSVVARVAHQITVGEFVVYTSIRNDNDFEELRELVMEVRGARFWPRLATLLTRGTAFAVALHAVAGLTMVFLVINGVVASDASDIYNVVIWSAMTAVAVTMMIAKAGIYVLKGD